MLTSQIFAALKFLKKKDSGNVSNEKMLKTLEYLEHNHLKPFIFFYLLKYSKLVSFLVVQSIDKRSRVTFYSQNEELYSSY